MRACVFTAELGSAASRREALLRELAQFTGQHRFDEVCFVGIRQTLPVDGVSVSQPWVAPDDILTARLANTVLRAASAGFAPQSLARGAVSLSSARFVESILACNPDVVLLDVRWARYLVPHLEVDFPGRVYVSGQRSSSQGTQLSRRTLDSSKTVSIVLPTYNGVKYLRQSIQSCLDQSYRNLELIVVDDGSAEDIAAIVGGFSDSRIRYVRHEPNRGLPASLNTGFQMATGQYLTWTSDDNYYAPYALERLTRFLNQYPGIGFVYSSMYIVNEATGGTPRMQLALPPEDLKRQNSIGGCFLYDRRVYDAVGEYKPGAVLVEDYDYWIRVSKRFRMQRLIEPLYYYRYHDASLTSKHSRDDVARRFEVVRQQNGLAATR